MRFFALSFIVWFYMNKKFIILVAVVALVALALMYRAAQSGTSLVYTPSDLAAQGADRVLSRIRVAGRVSPLAEIHYQTEPRAELRFSIVDPPPKAQAGKAGELTAPLGYDAAKPASENSLTASGTGGEAAVGNSSAPIPVVYRGLRPDMFTSGRDVIIDGEFRDGVLTASSLLTQCPSKYEAPSPEHKFKVDGDKPQGSAS